ncbi:MAG: hypothetical protein ACK5W9_01330 [Bdellovibrionales bacterium]
MNNDSSSDLPKGRQQIEVITSVQRLRRKFDIDSLRDSRALKEQPT